MLIKRSILVVLLVLSLSGLAWAQAIPPSFNAGAANADACEAYPHNSIPLTFSAATALTQQIALSAGKAIYICGLTFVTGATSTLQLEYGTGTNCATGTVALSGVYIASSTVTLPANASIMTTPAGQALCAVTTGATGQANGWLSYVQF